MNKKVKQGLMANHNPTPLEALKKCEWCIADNGWMKYRRKDIGVIKTALNKAKKEQKALKVIIDKRINIYAFLDFMRRCVKNDFILESYNSYVDKSRNLTLEEVKLVKKVVEKYGR